MCRKFIKRGTKWCSCEWRLQDSLVVDLKLPENKNENKNKTNQPSSNQFDLLGEEEQSEDEEQLDKEKKGENKSYRNVWTVYKKIKQRDFANLESFHILCRLESLREILLLPAIDIKYNKKMKYRL